MDTQAIAARLTALWNQVARAEDEALGDHLSMGSFSHLINPLLFQLEQAEQQRDAAHAALKEAVEYARHEECADPESCDGTHWTCVRCKLTTFDLAALAASAPQKEGK